MSRSAQWVGTASALAFAFAPSVASAAAVGTAASTVISNSVVVSYSVGGVAQSDITSAADQITVDRKIDVVVATTDTAAVTVTPGQTSAVTSFTVTNNSNDTVDYILSSTDQTNNTASKFGGNDTINTTAQQIYVESNGSTGWQAGDTATNRIYQLTSGSSVTVYVVSSIPLTAAQGDIATVILTAQTATGATQVTGNAGTSGSGSVLAQDNASANVKNTVQTVFADAQAETATGDGLKDGKHAARSDYKVDTATLSVSKVSRLVSDPFNGTTNPKAIPGAVIEYCLVVKNTSTTVDASSVKVADTIDSTKLTSISAPTIGGTYTSATDTCSGGTAGTWGSTAGNKYEYTLGTVAKNTTSLVYFQATIK